MQVEIGNAIVELIEGDITRQASDAIVNAANSALIGGGGVDGAIHRAAGPELIQELEPFRAQGGCPTGSAVPTSARRLPAKFVFHAVGPIYGHGGPDVAADLASCYRTCLHLAAERNLHSISFPSISTGAYGYPLREAADIAIDTVCTFLVEHAGASLRHVFFVLWGDRAFAAYAEALVGWKAEQVE
jgi:O-acetyl-ADP-ribose deacetylase (regulator of RNase III)